MSAPPHAALLPRPPEEGARRLALSYLDQAARARPRLADPADAEALHDFRVGLRRLRSCLPHAWWIGVGISFSFVSGESVRAPLWIQRAGFEWLHRLVQEPRRLAKRYLVQGMPYAVVLLYDALRRGIAKRFK